MSPTECLNPARKHRNPRIRTPTFLHFFDFSRGCVAPADEVEEVTYRGQGAHGARAFPDPAVAFPYTHMIKD